MSQQLQQSTINKHTRQMFSIGFRKPSPLPLPLPSPPSPFNSPRRTKLQSPRCTNFQPFVHDCSFSSDHPSLDPSSFGVRPPISPPRRRLQHKQRQAPFSSAPILSSTTAAIMISCSTLSPDQKKIKKIAKKNTPMGRAAPRFVSNGKKNNRQDERKIEANVEGAGISGVKALTNGGQMVNSYLQSLWSGSEDVCPRPVPPQMFRGANDGSDGRSDGIDVMAGGGLITIFEHQRVLAIVLRDYTNRLSVAYKSAMDKSDHAAGFNARSLNARLKATTTAFRQSKEDGYSQETFIRQLLSERDNLKIQVETLSKEKRQWLSEMKRRTMDAAQEESQQESPENSEQQNGDRNERNKQEEEEEERWRMRKPGKAIISPTKSKDSLRPTTNGSRWETPEPTQSEQADLVSIVSKEKDDMHKGSKEKLAVVTGVVVVDEAEEGSEEGSSSEEELSEITKSLDLIEVTAREASLQVRADMREERNHATKMRETAIKSVKHSITELELSNDVEEGKKADMLDKLNSSLKELEGSGFKASRRGSFVGLPALTTPQ